jgi:hypothetical protein
LRTQLSEPSSQRSFSNVGEALFNKRAPMPEDYHPEILLDSGAYTNFKMEQKAKANPKLKFTPCTVETYSDFVEKNKDKFIGYFNMDAINHQDKEASARDSRDNYLQMRKRGLTPIPVFHQGEDISWLHRMLDDGAEYIALAVASTLHSRDKEKGWYDVVWNSLINAGGGPALRVHALGDTREFSLRTYPWYSCDSSSWAQSTGKGGRIKLHSGGKSINISIRRDGRSTNNERDLESFTGPELERLLHEFGLYGIDYKRLVERRPEDHIYRLFLGMIHYMKMQEEMHQLPPRTLRPGGLIDFRKPIDKPTVPVAGPKIFLASWLSYEFNTVFKVARYPHILLSYAWLGGVQGSKLKHGVELFRGINS